MTLKEEEVFDAQPTQDEKVAEWETLLRHPVKYITDCTWLVARRACVVLTPMITSSMDL